MSLTVTFHDFKQGLKGAGSSSAPINVRPVDHLGATFKGETEGYFSFDTSYPTGGYALSANQLGLSKVFGLIAESPGGYDLQYNRTTGKLQVFNGSTEVANATNLSALQSAYYKAFGVV